MNATSLFTGGHWLGACLFLYGASLPVRTYAADTDQALAYRQAAPGLLERKLYTSPPVEIVDLLVGPGQLAERASIEPGALLDVQAGNALLAVNGRKQNVRPGSVIALKPGQVLSIDNRKQERPFVARLIRVPGATP